MSNWNLNTYRHLFSNHYTELRAQENRSFMITMLNGQIIQNSSTTEKGLSSRLLANGSWGFASHPEISQACAEKIIKEATANSLFMSEKAKNKIQLFKAAQAKTQIDLSTKEEKLTVQTLIDQLKKFDDHMKITYPDLMNRSLRVYQQDFIKDGLNSAGAETYSHYARSYLVVTLSMDTKAGAVSLRKVFGDAGQIEDTFPTFEEFKSELEVYYVQLKDKANGTLPNGGRKQVILSSRLAGILAHEAIGHTTEADLVLGGSVAGDYLNKMVASPLVNLVDFAHTALGKQAPMPVLFDDEGTVAEDTVIIENGILKTFMNSKETAYHFEQKATGHARAWAFNDEPLIRMRNTAILPGQSSLADMIASIDDGYYLMDHSNGQADSTSEFTFGVTQGYEIKNGKLGRAILDTTISGIAFDMLKSVSMVSNEMTWVSSGTCGKKQPMTVGMGGPAVKCEINIGGR